MVAEGLTMVGTDLYRACAFVHFWKWKVIERDVVLLATIEEREGWPRYFLTRADVVRLCRRWWGKRIAVMVHLVAGETWHCWLIG